MANYALNFTGSGDATQNEGYIAIANAHTDIVDLTNNFTVATWVKTTSGGATNKWYPILSTMSEDSGMSGPGGWALARLGTTYGGEITAGAIKNRYGMILADGTNYTVVGANQIDDAEWHHVIGIRDGGTTKIWIDGTAQSGTTTTAPVDPNQGSNGQAVLGRWGSYSGHMGEIEANGHYINGTLDQTAVWNVVLSGAEITELYNSGDAYDATNIQAANLILYYKYDGGPGNSTLTDSSAGGNDHVGTLTNMIPGTAGTPCPSCRF